MQANIPGPLLAAFGAQPQFIRGDIEANLGPPVTIISEVKIYDTATLHNPPLSIERYGVGDQLQKYLEQSGGELTHLFIRNAELFIAQVRDSAQKVEGLLPPLELAISTLKTAFRLIYDGIISQGLGNKQTRALYKTLIYHDSPSRNLSNLDQLVNHQTYYMLPDTEENDQFIEEVAQMIKLTYEGLGYEWSYFGFVKRDHPLRMSKTGRVPLKPNTFEAFGLFYLAPNRYIEMQDDINATHRRKKNGRQSCFTGNLNHDIPKMGGWKKQDLFEAIKRSGLWKDISGLKRQVGIKGLTTTMGIAFKDLGLADPNPRQQIVRGLATQPYMSLCYYETLYRRIYSTNDYIDWPLLCKLGAITLENIRKAAVGMYAAKPEQVANASAGEICRYVIETSRKRTELTKRLALATQERQEDFVGQPGSRWIQPETMQRRGPLGEIVSQPANDYQLYQAVKQYCQDQNITKEQMLAYAEALNIRSYLPDTVEQYSKADLCEYLLDFLLPRAERYESVLVDCADPAIGVRHILNAATIMELGAIFPKDVSKLTKEAACEILSNYIKLLRDNAGLNFARQPRRPSD